MRDCFAFRFKPCTLVLAIGLSLQIGMCLPVSAQAEASWMDVLKPLVKDVIVPSASAQMKKWVAKKAKIKLDDNSSDTSAGWQPLPEESGTGLQEADPNSVFSTPQEPISGSDFGGFPTSQMDSSSDGTPALPPEP